VWTTPHTWVIDEVPTATLFNAHLRDNQTFLYSPPSCRVYRTTSQSLTTATVTAITFDAERWDTDSMHSTVSGTDRITIVTAGAYLVIGQTQYAPNATGVRETSLRLGGTGTVLDRRSDPSVSASLACVIGVGTTTRRNAGDYLQLECYQTSGGALNVEAASQLSPEFMAHWVGGT
jgi:hypothetical protein